MAKDKLLNKALIFCLLLVICFSFFAITSDIVFAQDNQSTGSLILDDLSKDSNFAIYNYPEDKTNNSLSVINIAESKQKELLIYVYEPSAKHKASSINISTTINDFISFNNYKLKFLNASGTLSKYVVENFVVKDDLVRYYEISSIFRPFDSLVDIKPDNDNVVNEVSYAVNKQYCFSTTENGSNINVVDTETIVVTDKFVGFCRYKDGFKLNPTACDSHFVAFNTDKPIDSLLEAKVFYTSQFVHKALINGALTFGDVVENTVDLSYTDKVEHQGTGLFAAKYSWNRIESVDDFIRQEDITQTVYSGAIFNVKTANKITDEGIKQLRGKKWILRFTETPFIDYAQTPQYQESTSIENVTILQLKFETDGKVYNLGVVDNKQTGSKTPINKEDSEADFQDWIKKLLGIILGVILLVLIIVLLSPLFPYIVKFLVWLITAPFKLIKMIIDSFKKDDKK